VWSKHAGRLAGLLLLPCAVLAVVGAVEGAPAMVAVALALAAGVVAMELFGAGTATASVLAALTKEQA